MSQIPIGCLMNKEALIYSVNTREMMTECQWPPILYQKDILGCHPWWITCRPIWCFYVSVPADSPANTLAHRLAVIWHSMTLLAALGPRLKPYKSRDKPPFSTGDSDFAPIHRMNYQTIWLSRFAPRPPGANRIWGAGFSGRSWSTSGKHWSPESHPSTVSWVIYSLQRWLENPQDLSSKMSYRIWLSLW